MHTNPSTRAEFVRFCLERHVLRFGEFALKSGRLSPYFFNSGLFNTGAALDRLGEYYAAAVIAAGVSFDMLFGPAYKGIPLVSTLACALARRHDRDVGYCFDRKEIKDHGEGGRTVGAPLSGRVLVVDDVISAGISVRGAIDIITAAGASPAGIVIALDRQERGSGELSAVQEVEQRYGIPVVSVIALADLVAFLRGEPARADDLQRIEQYQATYGIGKRV